MNGKRKALLLAGLLILGGWGCLAVAQQPPIAQEQPIENEDRIRVRVMLEDIQKRLRKEYYDPSFHGVDIEGRFQEAKARIEKATSLNQALGIIAWVLEGLNDSHTFFLPPPRPYDHDYVWRMVMVGEKCYVIAVKPGSDAERQGLKTGDEVESVNGVVPTRETLPKIAYLFNILRPQPGLILAVRTPDGQQRTLEILAEFRQKKRTLRDPMDFYVELLDFQNARHLWRDRYHEVGSEVLIWKMPAFDMDPKAVDARIGKAREYKTLILDLRGNPGGRQDALLRMIGHFFDQDVTL